MFDHKTYQTRRQQLLSALKSGVVFLLGHEQSPMSYKAHLYPFRQESSFLYYCGLAFPKLAVMIDIDAQKEYLVGDEVSVAEMVWTGEQPTLKDLAQKTGMKEVMSWQSCETFLKAAKKQNRTVHFLPQFRGESKIKLHQLLEISLSEAAKGTSAFIQQVVAQRIVKSAEEINEIKNAMQVTKRMHELAMQMSRPGIVEQEVVAQMSAEAIAHGRQLSYPIIFSVHGEFLHNEHYNNVMQDGQLILNDSAASSPLFYASDITRTFPVNGKFSTKQREIYQLVHDMQALALSMIKPGVSYRDMHLAAALCGMEGLKKLGLMQGDMQEAVAQGAYALFFPHGLGHALGLDVHDMEALGESAVGYPDNIKRSEQFGLNHLRFARALMPGYVLTVEPGIYFIPLLIRQWQQQNKFTQYINYEALASYLDFGGIRIEDNIVVTEQGYENFSKDIAKSIDAVEQTCSSAL